MTGPQSTKSITLKVLFKPELQWRQRHSSVLWAGLLLYQVHTRRGYGQVEDVDMTVVSCSKQETTREWALQSFTYTPFPYNSYLAESKIILF